MGFTRDQGGVNIYSKGVGIDKRSRWYKYQSRGGVYKRSRRSKYLVKGWGLTRDLGGVNIYSQSVGIDKR